MGGGYDIGASASLSSGATSGNIGAVEQTGGNTASSTPPWIWLGLGAMVFVIAVAWIWQRRGK